MIILKKASLFGIAALILYGARAFVVCDIIIVEGEGRGLEARKIYYNALSDKYIFQFTVDLLRDVFLEPRSVHQRIIDPIVSPLTRLLRARSHQGFWAANNPVTLSQS